MKIRTKSAILVTLTVGLLGLSVFVSIRGVLYAALRDNLNDLGFALGRQIGIHVEDLVMAQEIPRLQLFLHETRNKQPNIHYLFVQSEDGRVLAHTFDGPFPAELLTLNPARRDRPFQTRSGSVGEMETMDMAIPLLEGFGEMHIGLYEREILAYVNRITHRILGVTLAMLTSGGMVALVLSRRVLAPLEEIIEVSRVIGGGDFSRRCHVSGPDELGQVGRAFNTMIDHLTETTVSRVSYREQSEFLQAILEAVPHPFYVIRAADYTIELANAAAGGTRTPGLPATCHERTHHFPDPCGSRRGHDCPLDEVRRTRRPVVMEHVHIDPSGAERYFEVHGYPMFDGQGEVARMIEYSFDVTDRRMSELALRRSEKAIQEMCFRLEEDRDRLQAAVRRISSLIRTVIVARRFDVRFDNAFLPVCSDVKHCAREACPCFGRTGTRCWQVAGTFCGGEVQGEFARKIGDCEGCEVFRGAVPDPISELGEHFNNMMHILEVKHGELTRAYEELKATQSQMLQREKMASIGQLAAGVAHEINNPMGFIASNLRSLERHAAKLAEFIRVQARVLESLPCADQALQELAGKRKALRVDYLIEDVPALIEESLEGADRVRTIVQNLKSFSRVDEVPVKPVNLNECLETTLHIVWNEIKYKAQVVKEYGDLPQVVCNPQEMNQVFLNLLINAAQAIEKEGVLTIRTWADAQDAYVGIADTGCGIPGDVIGRIFEPFFTTKEAGKGTGLGLSISYDIVKKHKGDIRVDSTVGRGTVFTVRLPGTTGLEGI